MAIQYIVDKQGNEHELEDIRITTADMTNWNAKQNALTAGSNISISGNTISATDTTYTAGNAIGITNNEIGLKTANGLGVNSDNELYVRLGAIIDQNTLKINQQGNIETAIGGGDIENLLLNYGGEQDWKTITEGMDYISLPYSQLPAQSNMLYMYVPYIEDGEAVYDDNAHITFVQVQPGVFIADNQINPAINDYLVKKIEFNTNNQSILIQVNTNSSKYTVGREFYFELWEEVTQSIGVDYIPTNGYALSKTPGGLMVNASDGSLVQTDQRGLRINANFSRNSNTTPITYSINETTLESISAENWNTLGTLSNYRASGQSVRLRIVFKWYNSEHQSIQIGNVIETDFTNTGTGQFIADTSGIREGFPINAIQLDQPPEQVRFKVKKNANIGSEYANVASFEITQMQVVVPGTIKLNAECTQYGRPTDSGQYFQGAGTYTLKCNVTQQEQGFNFNYYWVKDSE